jgi:histidine triad (HIT) family protein
MQSSIFSKIIAGEVPAHRIYEDDRCIAILDIHPINPGHTLLIPKKEVDHLWDLPMRDYEHLWSVAHRLAGHLRNTMQPPRVGVVVEGFGVAHTHIHIIPLLHGDDIKKHQDTTAEPDHDSLRSVAMKLKV